MKVLDLFAGLKGWSGAFAARGHEVFSVDYDIRFDVDSYIDVVDLQPSDLPWVPDIILASPPCQKFSVMAMNKNWDMNNQPITVAADQALIVVEKTMEFIELVHPKFWILENPRGKLRKLYPMTEYERRTVTYCQYGSKFMKPTDLWGGFSPSLVLNTPCISGSPCHVSAKRGSHTGIQSSDKRKYRGGVIEEMSRVSSTSPERQLISAITSKIPYELSQQVCIAAEKDLR